jgi:choice-of-anchor A domain-containing protein
MPLLPLRACQTLSADVRHRSRGQRRPTGKGRFRARPAVEELENRTLLSTAASPLGVAADFNVFVLGALNQSVTDVQGRVAAGGDAHLTDYGVGDGLTNSAGQRDDLVVGGALTYTRGQVFNGNVVTGGTASLTGVGLPNGTARQGTPVDFTAAAGQLTGLSAAWAALAANGVASVANGSLSLTGTDPALDVFAVSGSQLASASGLTITAPAGATVLVNVSGSAGQLQSLGMSVSSTDRQHVLFNFPAASTLTLGGVSFQGSILAPLADVTFNNGNLEGTLIARSLTGNGEFHNFPTQVQITATAPPPVTPPAPPSGGDAGGGTPQPTTPPAVPLSRGMTATIGFWQGPNGQALINACGPTADGRTLANWLATTFPQLYGRGGMHELTGRSNAAVATLFRTLFAVHGQKVEAQILATALAMFTTSKALNAGAAGEALAAHFGFVLSDAGTGAALWNVGGNGAAFGVAPNTTVAVRDLLQRTCARVAHGRLCGGSTTLTNQTNTVFSAINQAGDI